MSSRIPGKNPAEAGSEPELEEPKLSKSSREHQGAADYAEIIKN